VTKIVLFSAGLIRALSPPVSSLSFIEIASWNCPVINFRLSLCMYVSVSAAWLLAIPAEGRVLLVHFARCNCSQREDCVHAVNNVSEC